MHSLRYIAAAVVALLFVAAVGCALWVATRPSSPPSPELITPAICLGTLPSPPAGPLFFNLEALGFLKADWEKWEAAYGSSSALPEEMAIQFDAATRAPQVWRALDRKWRFGAVLLTGDPGNFRPLLDHLRASEDWKLTQIDPTSYLFKRRPEQAWSRESLGRILDTFARHPKDEQHMARIQLAHRLLFIDEIPQAKALLREVIQGDADSVGAWTEMASAHGMSGEWKESMEAAERALSLDPRYRPARMAQANAFYAMGRFDKALMVTRRLYQEIPSDGPVLLLHAKVAHAAHAYHEEIDVLQTMITAAKSASQPAGLLQIYLGQAYAALGDSSAAQEQLQTALKDESLSETDRAFARKALERFESGDEFFKNTPSLSTSSSLLDAPSKRP